MSHAIDATGDPARRRARPAITVRRAAFCLVAAVIYLGPAPGQLFGLHSPWLREWVMFSRVGEGILDGAFTLVRPDGPVETYTPLEAAGLARYPIVLHYLFPRRVRDAGDLGRFAAPLCARAPAGAAVSFRGAVGDRDGWRPLQAEDVCAGAETAR